MHSAKTLMARTIQEVCRSWDGKDTELLMATLRRARSVGFEHSFPKKEHTPLGDLMKMLDLLSEKYAITPGDRDVIKEALIGEMQSGYRREEVENPSRPRKGP